MTEWEHGKLSSGEDDLIARYFKPLATDPGALGLTDDAAILSGGADDIVVTTDALVEGVHFLGNDPPETVAKKALRVNLSDLAAKGATPAGFVLTLALRNVDEAWLAPFAHGLGDDAAAFGCPLLGGDTVSTSGPLMISITAFGRVPRGGMIRRASAQPGDRVVVASSTGEGGNRLVLFDLSRSEKPIWHTPLESAHGVVWAPSVPAALVTLAIAQMGIHLVFFLHITTGPDNTNNVLALAFGILAVALILGGSVWIMAHLAGHMTAMEQMHTTGAAAPQMQMNP